MAFVVVHNETKKYIARKHISNSEHRLTDDIGAAQLFNTKGSATSTIKIMHDDFKRYRHYGWYDNVPSDGFTIHNVELVLGDPVD